MKKAVKVLSLLLAVAMVAASFAGCSAKEADTPQSGETASGQTERKKLTDYIFGSSAPETSEEMIDAYNAALAQNAPACTSSSQTVTAGKLWLGDDSESYMDLLAQDQAALRAKFEQSSVPDASLPALLADNVAEATLQDNTVTFQLNSISVQSSVVQGQGGYCAIIDDARTQELVEGVKEYAGVSGNVKINEVTYGLSGGTLAVTFDDKFSQIVSAEYTAAENVRATMRYVILDINVDLDYALTADFG